MKRRVAIAIVAAASIVLLGTAAGYAQDNATLSKPSPEGARVYIVWPSDGQVIRGGKFWLRMGLSGMGVAPAGVDVPHTGHHHVIIDAALPPLDQPIPNDKNHLHFGAGQTEARIELPPGRHTLQLVLGDANHIPFRPMVASKQITVIVPQE
jgi:Domain of unknown function (DUF4399)